MTAEEPTSSVGTESATTVVEDRDDDRAPSTLLNAVIGTGVSLLFLSFVGPFAPVLGGAVSGYLEGGDLRDGAIVGGVGGLLTAIPILLLAGLVVLLGVFVPEGVPFGVLAVVIAGFLTALLVGLGVVGGIAGVYVKQDVL